MDPHSINLSEQIRVGRSGILFIFCQLIPGQNCFLGLYFNIITINPINNVD